MVDGGKRQTNQLFILRTDYLYDAAQINWYAYAYGHALVGARSGRALYRGCPTWKGGVTR